MTPKQQAAIRDACPMCKGQTPFRGWRGWYHAIPHTVSSPRLRCGASALWEAVDREDIAKERV